jgi:hypothetical protein
MNEGAKLFIIFLNIVPKLFAFVIQRWAFVVVFYGAFFQ